MRISDWSSDVCSSDLSRISVDDADQSAAVRAGPEVARALCLPYGSAVAEPYPPAGAWMAAHDGRCDRGHPGCHAIDARREGAPHDDGFPRCGVLASVGDDLCSTDGVCLHGPKTR